MTECFDAICGYDDDHDYGDECTKLTGAALCAEAVVR